MPQEFSGLFPWWLLTCNQFHKKRLLTYFGEVCFGICTMFSHKLQSFFFFLFTHSPVRTHTDHSRWHTSFWMYFWQILDSAVPLKMSPLAVRVKALKGSSGPWRRGQHGSCWWLCLWWEGWAGLREGLSGANWVCPTSADSGASGLSGHIAWGPQDRFAPTGASDIALPSDVNPPPSTFFYVTCTIWSGGWDVTLWDEVSKYKIMFLTSVGTMGLIFLVFFICLFKHKTGVTQRRMSLHTQSGTVALAGILTNWLI